jgi:hypothetical protein
MKSHQPILESAKSPHLSGVYTGEKILHVVAVTSDGD